MEILGDLSEAQVFVEERLDRTLAQTDVSPQDRRLVQELVFGVVRWKATLDWLIARKTDGRPQKPLLMNLLRLGLYQLFWLDRVPNYAAVNESVEIAKQRGLGPQSGFINAVLRGYCRQRDATLKLLEQMRLEDPPVGLSHPRWLCERWEAPWGRERMIQLLEWNNRPPRTYVRINTLKMNMGELTSLWAQEQVEFAPASFDWIDAGTAFELKAHPSMTSLKSFKGGGFYVQDPSTLLAARLLDPRPGERVLDACAAPGGKACFMAQLMGNQGSIVAEDVFNDRIQLVRENGDRLGVTCMETRVIDIADTLPEEPPFDRILLDVPCSNTGVMRRRVDLRWRITPEEIERLSRAQAELLARHAPRLKPGGVLVYSTCSLEPEENHGVVQQFVAAHPEFRLDLERQLTPMTDATDGAYAARLVRS